MKTVKRSIPFLALIATFFMGGLSIDRVGASQNLPGPEENERENILRPLKRRLEDKKKLPAEEPASKRACVEDSPSEYLLDILPPELQMKVFSFIPQGGHKSIQNFVTSKVGHSLMFDDVREIYKGLTEYNLQYSIPSQEIIKYVLMRPASFEFYDRLVEARLIPPFTTNQSYFPNEKDIISLGEFLLKLKYIGSIRFLNPHTLLGRQEVMRMLEILKEKELLKLEFSPVCIQDAVREAYERHLLKEIWPLIKQMSFLHSLDLDIEDEDILNTIIREITDLDLPLKSLTVGFIVLTDKLSDGVALLIANSSYLKTLMVHDIVSDVASLKPIITSVIRNPSFDKFIIGIRGDSNDVSIEDKKTLIKLVKGNDKFDFEDLL